MRRDERRNRELMGDTSSRRLSWAAAAGMATNKPVLGATLLGAVMATFFMGGMWHGSAMLLLASVLLIVVAPQISSAGFWKRLKAIKADDAPVLPDALEFRDPMVGTLIQRIARARQLRTRAIDHSPYGSHHALSRSQAALCDLERRAIVVAARAEYVSNFLSDEPDGGAAGDAEVLRLRSAEQRAPSPDAGAAYGRAASWSVERCEAVRRLQARRATLIGTLEHLATALETMPAKMTDLEMARIDDGDGLIGGDPAEAELELFQLDALFNESRP